MFDPALLDMREVQAFLLCLVRCMALIAATPVLGAEQVPRSVKTGLALVMAIALFPPVAMNAELKVPATVPELAIALVLEALMGAAMGFSARAMFTVVQFAGGTMGFMVGLSMANVMDPTTNIQVPILGQILNIFTMLLFLIAGGHHWMLQALVQSFEVVPMGMISFERIGPLGQLVIDISADIFFMGFQIAAPIMVVIMIKHAVMGMIGKMAPQINLLTVGIPIQIFFGILVLGLLLPTLRVFLENLFYRFQEHMLQVMYLFRP